MIKIDVVEKNSVSKEIKLTKPVKGQIIKNKVIISKDFQKARQFYDRSCFGEIYGEKEKRLEFSLDEALYLFERKKLEIYDNKKKLNFEELLEIAKKLEKDFWIKYQIYRDIRTRGYITKTALKFGADYRVYPRGARPEKAHAKWLLFCASEGQKFTWRQFAAMNRVAHSTKKKLLLGIVDAEGDVVYYEIHWKKP